jgi:hypothetical protein
MSADSLKIFFCYPPTLSFFCQAVRKKWPEDWGLAFSPVRSIEPSTEFTPWSQAEAFGVVERGEQRMGKFLNSKAFYGIDVWVCFTLTTFCAPYIMMVS